MVKPRTISLRGLGARRARRRSSARGMQAETLIEIVERKQRPNGRYIVLERRADEQAAGVVHGAGQRPETGRGAGRDTQLRRYTAGEQALDAPLQRVRVAAGVRTVRPGVVEPGLSEAANRRIHPQAYQADTRRDRSRPRVGDTEPLAAPNRVALITAPDCGWSSRRTPS